MAGRLEVTANNLGTASLICSFVRWLLELVLDGVDERGGIYQACFDVCGDSVLHCPWRPGLWLPAPASGPPCGNQQLADLKLSGHKPAHRRQRLHTPPSPSVRVGGGEEGGSYCGEGRGKVVIVTVVRGS